MTSTTISAAGAIVTVLTNPGTPLGNVNTTTQLAFQAAQLANEGAPLNPTTVAAVVVTGTAAITTSITQFAADVQTANSASQADQLSDWMTVFGDATTVVGDLVIPPSIRGRHR